MGSSIAQGGCASRPGNAKDKSEIADYIASLDIALFVYDCDHNAPTVEHLLATHKPMLKTFRKS